MSIYIDNLKKVCYINIQEREKTENNMTKILFVCHGNICRSPMAEFIMKKIVSDAGESANFYIESAATSTEEIGNPVHYGTRQVLRKYNIDFSKKRAVQITSADYKKYDYIIGMDSYNLRNMKRIFGEDKDNKLSLLLDYTDEPRDVADPWYTGDFGATEADVLNGCRGLFKKLKES